MQVKEQQNLMIKLDMSRIEEMGVLRHAKGMKEEMMVDKAQDTVEEWRLVPLKMNVDTDVQVDMTEVRFSEESVRGWKRPRGARSEATVLHE